MSKKILFLKNGGGYKQKDDLSCWAACARFILNYYNHNQPKINSDTMLAHVCNTHIDQEQQIENILTTLSIYDQADSAVIPTFSEIETEITNNYMICALVNPKPQPRYNLRSGHTGGHYVVIHGYDSNYGVPLIYVMDPATGQSSWIKYNNEKYENEDAGNPYWCGSAYTKPPHSPPHPELRK